MLKNLAKGRFPALIGADRKASWVFLDDVVDGIVRVIERAPPGRDYLLAGDVATVRELADASARSAASPSPRRELSPGFAARGAHRRRAVDAPRRPPAADPAAADRQPGAALGLRRRAGAHRARLAAAQRSPRGLPPTVEFLLAQPAAEAA